MKPEILAALRNITNEETMKKFIARMDNKAVWELFHYLVYVDSGTREHWEDMFSELMQSAL
ncbi:hypothetical protein D3C81_1949490 [compost metagenome]